MPRIEAPRQCFNQPLPDNNSSQARPCPYKLDLTPITSPLRPHCLTCQWLLSWHPSVTSPHSMSSDPNQPLSDKEIDHIVWVIGASWSEATKELYGMGILIFHVYCNIHGIPEHHCALVSSHVFSAFLSSCAGAYSGSSISNYAAAVCMWHLLHGMEWRVNKIEYKALLEGATRLAPASSKRTK